MHSDDWWARVRTERAARRERERARRARAARRRADRRKTRRRSRERREARRARIRALQAELKAVDLSGPDGWWRYQEIKRHLRYERARDAQVRTRARRRRAVAHH